MGEHYGQLSLAERVEIYRLHAGGKSLREIGAALARAPSTIKRELQRNGRRIGVWPGGYDPVRADGLAKWRRRRDKHTRTSTAMAKSPSFNPAKARLSISGASDANAQPSAQAAPIPRTNRCLPIAQSPRQRSESPAKAWYNLKLLQVQGSF